MFWDTKDPPSHNIEILLESPDTKVEVFLEEDNIIQECKTLKKNIVNYFTRPDVIRRMIELITTEPPEEAPMSERFRHANVACEILTMGLPSLDEKLLADADTLNMLYSYLENEPPLNPLLASFFSKTFSVLFTKKSDQDWFLYQQTCLKLLEYLKTKSNFLDLICKHFSTPIVPDLIMEMMQNVEGGQLKRSLYEWLNDERLVEKLIEIIGDPEQSDKHANVADFLCDLVHQGRTMRQGTDCVEPDFGDSDPLLKKIESATTLLALCDVILQPNAAESAIVSGITVLLKIIRQVKMTDERNMERFEYLTARESEIHDEFLKTVIRVIEPQLKHFNALLKNPPKRSDILTTAANLSPPFGMARLQICRLFTELLKTTNEEIFKAICETDFLDILLSLFKEYCWNNFLHSEVEKCLHIIFPYSSSSSPKSKTENNTTEENKNSLEKLLDNVLDKVDLNFLIFAPSSKAATSKQFFIQTHAIVNCKIISKLIECWKINMELESAEKGRRLGYMGHLINIFKHITNCASESESVGALIDSNFKDDNERDLWHSIVNPKEGDLTKALELQDKLLANYESCEHNVSLDFFTDNNISDAFNGLCTLMDSSDAFGQSNEDEEGDEDENAATSFDGDSGLRFYVEPHANPFTEDPWENNPEVDDMMRGPFDLKGGKNPKIDKAFADFEAFCFNYSSTSNTNEATVNATENTPVTTTSSEEYDNNANVEKSSSWSGDFTSFQIPQKDAQYTSNFIDDYEDDEGMWTKPLGATLTAPAEHSETQTADLTNQTDEFKTNFVTNGPCTLEEHEHGLKESSTNTLNNSIEDKTFSDPTAADITPNKNQDETAKEINNEVNLKQEEETTSKHNIPAVTTNDIKTENTNTTTNDATPQLTNTATITDEISDDSNTANTTTTTLTTTTTT